MNSLRWLYRAVHGRAPQRPRRKPRRGLSQWPKYRAWIRTFPCIVCGTTRGVEAAHTGPHALGRKSSGFTCLPLCGRDHRTGRHSYHNLGPARFQRHHRINIPRQVEHYNVQWAALQERRAA